MKHKDRTDWKSAQDEKRPRETTLSAW
jgi:hypothetical protein